MRAESGNEGTTTATAFSSTAWSIKSISLPTFPLRVESTRFANKFAPQPFNLVKAPPTR